MTFSYTFFCKYDTFCLIIPFCTFRNIISLSLCSKYLKNYFHNEKSFLIFKNFIDERFNFDGETQLIQSAKHNFFIKYATPYTINDNLQNKLYNKANISKTGYGIFLNFYSQLHKIINKINNAYKK